MKIDVHELMIHHRLLKFAEKIDDRKFRRIAQIAQRTYFFWVCNFHEFIFLGLIFPGIYFFGYPKKCLGRAPLSCTCQSTLPGHLL